MSAGKNVLAQIFSDLDGKVFDYGSDKDFEKLWSFEELPQNHLVVVWARTASDGKMWPIDASACLSPLDWAAAYAKHLADKGDDGNVSDLPEVLIIDLAPKVHQKFPSLTHFHTLNGDQLPWLQVVEDPSVADIAEWLRGPEWSWDVERHPKALDRFLREIRLNLTEVRSEGDFDRHSISNVVAPMVLLGRAREGSRHSSALLALLNACGLCGDAGKKQEGMIDEAAGLGHANRLPQSAEQGDGERLSILLVDDQADHGWTEWLRTSLPEAQVEALTAPNLLLDALEAQFKEAAGVAADLAEPRDLRFRFQLPHPKLKDAKNPVLFLDLRLFSGRGGEERKFFRRLLDQIDQRFKDNKDLAWPAFSSKDSAFQNAREVIEEEGAPIKLESPIHREALTWLPRLIALADMSMPIILFSSTGRRDLVEPFRDFGNIITSFEKPRLSDLAGSGGAEIGDGEAALHDLRDALEQARRWLNGRAVGVKVGREIDLAPLAAARDAFSGKTHFEIYHDESGEVEKSYFRVFSILAGFQSGGEADDYDGRFPIRFHGQGCEDKRAADGDEKKRWGEYWGRIGPDAPPLLLASCVRDRNTQDTGEADSIFDAQGLDNINWDLLALMWESLLADVLPALLKHREADEEITLSLFGATRFRPVDLAADNARSAVKEANDILLSMRDRWGMDLLWSCRVVDQDGNKVSFPDKDREQLGVDRHYRSNHATRFKFLWRSLKPDSFWKLVAEVLFGRSDSPRFHQVADAIDCAKGEMLVYGADKSPSSPVSSLHYVADLCGNLIDVDLAAETVSCASEPFELVQSQAVLSFRRRLLLILNGNRLADAGDCDAEAIACFRNLDLRHPEDLAYLSLAERLCERLPCLSGADLSRMVSLLAEPPAWLDRGRLAVPERIARKSAEKSLKAQSHYSKSGKFEKEGRKAKTAKKTRLSLKTPGPNRKSARVVIVPSLPDNLRTKPTVEAEFGEKISGAKLAVHFDNNLGVIAEITFPDASGAIEGLSRIQSHAEWTSRAFIKGNRA